MEEKLFVCDANLHRRTRAIDVLCDLDILSERKREQIIFLLLSNNFAIQNKNITIASHDGFERDTRTSNNVGGMRGRLRKRKIPAPLLPMAFAGAYRAQHEGS
jgi:hypothetical protein